MAKKNLFRANIRKGKNKTDERTIYVVADDMMKAAKLMSEELAVEEELREIIQISEECYVG